MALSDFEIFNEYVYSTWSEVVDQKVRLFNSASSDTITLSVAPKQGSFNSTAFFAKIAPNLVRRRNPFSDATVANVDLTMSKEVEVKVAAGTHPVRIDKAFYEWIKMNPEEGGVVVGQQMAEGSLADMLNTALGAGKAALSGEADVYRDITGATTPGDLITGQQLILSSAQFGDRAQAIEAWVMHSQPLHQMYLNAMNNAEKLFVFGNVKVIQDGFGRIFIVSDSPALAQAGAAPTDPVKYSIMGLQRNGLRVTTNDDFTQADVQATGHENIQRTYQAEWSYNLGVKGFAYNTAAGQAPNDAAIMNSANWLKCVSSHKDLAGVLLEGHISL